ncbi:MAG: chemotaxis protein CheB [Desulfofustis sp.]
MEAKSPHYAAGRRIRVLLVDDSELFRRFIIELLEDNVALEIAAEAASGIQALALIEDLAPDVVLLDMEMPGLDGMETLRRINERFPVPVMMLSSLSREGSARSFDCLKNGAIDFIGKDSLHPRKGAEKLKSELLYRIVCASRIQTTPINFEDQDIGPLGKKQPVQQRVIFCEDCGARNVVNPQNENNSSEEYYCSQCGDQLNAIVITAYRRLSSLGVVGAGRGAAANLLKIVPQIPAQTSAAVLIVLHESRDYPQSLTRYLNALSSIKVVGLEDGMNIEGGHCYISSSHDGFSMVSHSTNYTIRSNSLPVGRGALDLMLESIAPIMKNRMLALFLSGNQLDGIKGIVEVRKNQGLTVVLNGAGCLCKELGENILRKSGADRIVSERECIEILAGRQDAQNVDRKRL